MAENYFMAAFTSGMNAGTRLRALKNDRDRWESQQGTDKDNEAYRRSNVERAWGWKREQRDYDRKQEADKKAILMEIAGTMTAAENLDPLSEGFGLSGGDDGDDATPTTYSDVAGAQMPNPTKDPGAWADYIMTAIDRPAPGAAIPETANEMPVTGADTSEVSGGAGNDDLSSAQDYMGALMNQGYPKHVAAAITANWNQESGLDSGINEIAPLVPGSRGGFGLAQWTGPRRRALEQFAAERGQSPDNRMLQLAFHEQEANTTEKAAMDYVKAAPDAATAAQRYSDKFLRPSAAHANNAGRVAMAQRLMGVDPGSTLTATNQTAIDAFPGTQTATPIRPLYDENADRYDDDEGALPTLTTEYAGLQQPLKRVQSALPTG